MRGACQRPRSSLFVLGTGASVTIMPRQLVTADADDDSRFLQEISQLKKRMHTSPLGSMP